MSILVTGGTGFIGSHTVVQLIECGYDVIIVDNLSNSKTCVLDRIENITGKRPTFIKCELCNKSEIDKVLMTGVGSSYVKHDLYGIKCVRVPEFDCIGKGGIYLSRLDKAVVVSMGTGTAIVHAERGAKMKYLGGTGVGGGTLIGLSKLLVGAADIGHISEFVEQGDLGNIDLRIKDMTASGAVPVMNADMTAANFGNVSDVATKSDIAKGVSNLVYETVGMVAIFASRSVGVSDIVLTGNLTRIPSCIEKFEEFNRLGYGVRFVVPEFSEFSTAIGCAISALD